LVSKTSRFQNHPAAILPRLDATTQWSSTAKGFPMKTRFANPFAAVLLALCFAFCCCSAFAQPRVIEVHARRYAFEPAVVTVKQGETVVLSMISDDVPHSLLIEGLNVNAVIVKDHASQVEIKADKTGDFVGRCGKFCGGGHAEMNFILRVTR
jgi:cytochrome c oxidase subunit II